MCKTISLIGVSNIVLHRLPPFFYPSFPPVCSNHACFCRSLIDSFKSGRTQGCGSMFVHTAANSTDSTASGFNSKSWPLTSLLPQTQPVIWRDYYVLYHKIYYGKYSETPWTNETLAPTAFPKIFNFSFRPQRKSPSILNAVAVNEAFALPLCTFHKIQNAMSNEIMKPHHSVSMKGRGFGSLSFYVICSIIISILSQGRYATMTFLVGRRPDWASRDRPSLGIALTQCDVSSADGNWDKCRLRWFGAWSMLGCVPPAHVYPRWRWRQRAHGLRLVDESFWSRDHQLKPRGMSYDWEIFSTEATTIYMLLPTKEFRRIDEKNLFRTQKWCA